MILVEVELQLPVGKARNCTSHHLKKHRPYFVPTFVLSRLTHGWTERNENLI